MQQQAAYARPKRPKKENSERWLLTYSDLITLLLAFFVIMYGISSADTKKFTKFSAAMKKAFNVDVLQSNPAASILDQTKGLSTDSSSSSDMSAAAELSVIYSQMGSVLQDDLIGDRLSIIPRSDGIAISVSGNLLFASGRADLRPDAVRVLRSVANVLRDLPNPVRVEGYTDDVPPSGTGYPTNWDLSGARAVAVVRYLTEIEGLQPGRFSAEAFSQYRPVAPNDSARDRAKNRRSEIVILNMPGVSTATPTGANGSPTPVATPERGNGSAGTAQ